MGKKIILLYFLLLNIVYASFELAPQIQYINLDRPGTVELHLKNPTKKLVKIKIYAQTPEDQKNKELDMKDWVIVYPRVVYLKPNAKQLVRMAIRAPKGLKDGEYRAYLVFEEMKTQKYSVEKTEVPKAHLDILYKIISTIYGYKGDLKYGANFSDFQFISDGKKDYFISKVENTGTTALDSYYRLTYYNGDREIGKEVIRNGKVMRENTDTPMIELKEIKKKADNAKIEFLYRVPKTMNNTSEYDEFKLGEKMIPIKKITKEEYFGQLEKEKEKKSVEETPKKDVEEEPKKEKVEEEAK